MKDIQQKFLKHAFNPKDYGTQLIGLKPHVAQRAMRLPVCPRCEKPALRDTRPYDPKRPQDEIYSETNGFITCPNCGYHGRFTHTVGLHMQEYAVQ